MFVLILIIGFWGSSFFATPSFRQDQSQEWRRPLYQKGMELLEKGLFEEAEKEFKTILEKDKRNSQAHYGLGMIYAQKGDISFKPRMFSNFKQNEKVGVYFEVYNLTYSLSSKTDYQVTYQMQPVGRRSLLKKILNLFRKKEEAVSTEYQYQGDLKDEKLYTSLELTNRPAGLYKIIITIKDLVIGDEVSKKVIVKVG